MILTIGYLRSYSGQEFHLALETFSAQYPYVSVRLINGNHEELFTLLINGMVDLVFNDQRRAFSDEYINLLLTTSNEYIEISNRNPISVFQSITLHDLKNIPCILVSSKEQREIEREYYQNVIGIQGNFIYAENLEEARLLVISGQGFMHVEGSGQSRNLGVSTCRIPLFRGNTQITRNYCLFWKKEHSGHYIKEFADILKSKFI